MNESPFVGFIKIAAFAILALFVSLVFWQRTELEDKTVDLGKKVSIMQEQIEKSAAMTRETNQLVEALRTAIEEAGKRGDNNQAGLGVGEVKIKTPEDYAWGDTPPPWVSGRAAELWGQNSKNFLMADPDEPDTVGMDDPRANADGEINLYYGSNPKDMNAITLNESDFNTRIRQYCSEFWAKSHTKNGYRYAPSLAYRVEHSADYKQWIFWIRPNVKWHTPQVDFDKYPHLRGDHFLTADDWKFTMDTVMDSTVDAAHHRAYFKGFSHCEVVDKLCFIMHWDDPTWTAIGANLELTRPVPKFVYGKDEAGNEIPEKGRGSYINDHWFGKEFRFVGTGPYYVREYRQDEVIIADRFSEYWGTKPSIKRRVMHIMASAQAAETEFESGALSYHSYRVPQLKRKVYTLDAYKEGRIGVAWLWSSSYVYIGYKNSHRIFRDVKVRRAMTHACDRVKILGLVNEGKGRVLTGPSYWRAPTAPKDIKPLEFDLDKARALLKEAGWADNDGDGILEKEIDGEKVPFKVTAKLPNGSEAILTVFKVFKEDLAKIGVELEVQTLVWAQYLKEVTDDRNFEVCSLGWNTSGWDSDFTQIWHSSQVAEPKSSNHIEFEDDQVDQLIEKARKTFGEKERIEVQGAVHRRLNELQPYTYLFTLEAAAVWWKDQISPISDATHWVTRPFMRLWPLYVPKK